jgi:recombinational DNA repair protein RecT
MGTKEIVKIDNLETNFIELSKKHLEMRAANNPEFQERFIKTFSDLVFSQNEEMLEKLKKTRPNSLLNAIFRATELGASFAKKEITFIPFAASKKETKNGVEIKSSTGEYDAILIPDINFQKQLILKLSNCKHFFTCEVHDGVEVISNLSTGNYDFIGKNDVTKPTIGYYAKFTSTDGEVYDCFMSCGEIIERAKFSPQYKPDNYKQTSNSIHFEKVVVRNLMKIIPKISVELQSTLSLEYSNEIENTSYDDVTEKSNKLEEAKKNISEVVSTEPDKISTEPEAPKTEAAKFF